MRVSDLHACAHECNMGTSSERLFSPLAETQCSLPVSCFLLSLDALPVHALVQVDFSDSARARRDAGEEIPMTIDVLGRTITVDLAPNRDLLPTSYVLQTVGEDGTLHTVPSHVRRDCYYTGRVEGSEGSHVAVEMCKDHEMVGWDALHESKHTWSK